MAKPRVRGNGEGSFYKLPNGRWQGQKIIDGKKVRRNGRTKAEIVKIFSDLEERARAGLVTSDVTMADFLDSWTKGPIAARPVAKRTKEHYAYMVECCIKPTLGKEKLQSLTADQVDGQF